MHRAPWPYPRVLAHRGGGAFAPENTVAAIRVGSERGFRAVEFDAMLSADGEAVLIHDVTLERTTNGTGPVAASSWAQLSRLDAGSWFSKEFAGEPIPRLLDALGFCRSHAVWSNVEIKPSPGDERRTGAVVADVVTRAFADLLKDGARPGELPDPSVPLLSSFSVDALEAAREQAPALAYGLLVERIPRDWRTRLERLGCVALHCDHRHLDAKSALSVREAGYWLFVYTVNDRPRALELVKWGVDAFCTDRLDRIEPSLLDARGP
ncbi:MAG: glycerophosphodiester phosphodiesterase [Burkholderiaceae bacterium]|nr:glycerophosphodiester phosphodiesterase [Burkholderiaceae bacterium]